ncbi:MAG: 2-C-methyl-D-erythritol 4-phosphate cytidylyltransferase [Capsulimonadales bacterium]|nr:2-C-methyl-D-erythritol 4-phosphate cytidylyltransferase [Capsulimonadales bacterium]
MRVTTPDTADRTATAGEAVCALIPAAGRGVRFGGTDNKVFSPLLDRPLLGWTLGAFAECADIEAIVLVGAPGELDRLREMGERYGGGKRVTVVAGGSDRQASVRNGLSACEDYPFVAVHDAARPCITPALISAAVRAGRLFGATTLAVPVADTLVRGHESVLDGPDVDRSHLYAIQTPQVFERTLLVSAHEIAARDAVHGTDDAGLVRRLRGSTHMVAGSPENLKVTRPEDLTLAAAILRGRDALAPSPRTAPDTPRKTAGVPFRVGHGYDVHPFAEGRPLFLGGVEFVGAERGLQGHSDADVILHALCDALLGAAGMPDIGKLFPPSEMRHKDRRSTEFLDEVRARLDAAGWSVGNADISVLAETPKIGPMAETIRRTIAVHLNIQPEQVGIKATTNEGMGFVGRREGIAVHATVLLFRSD